jgi:hypothetical protein
MEKVRWGRPLTASARVFRARGEGFRGAIRQWPSISRRIRIAKAITRMHRFVRATSLDNGNQTPKMGGLEHTGNWAGVILPGRHRVNNGRVDKLMQVAVGPAHGRLKDLVQAIEFDAAGDLKPPPDGRLAAAQRDFEFVEG